MISSANNPLVSIVIPVYNESGVLEDCLKMLIGQDYPLFEIIIINNNSNDKTAQIIEQFKRIDSRICSDFEPYRSRGAARKRGVEMAQGEIIVSINADCVFGPSWLTQLTKPIILGQAKATNGNSYFIKTNYWARQADLANKAFIRRQVKNGFCTGSLDTKNFAIEASLLKSVNFNPVMKAMEDFDLFLRLKRFCLIKFLPEVSVGDKKADTFYQTVKTSFERAAWTYRIYRHHRDLNTIENEFMFESISWLNFFSLPFWLVWQSLRQSPSRSFYSLISELAWRGGLAYAWLGPNKL